MGLAIRDNGHIQPHRLDILALLTKGRGDFRVKQWNPLLELLDLENRGFHHLRHKYATLTLGAGVPVRLVPRFLGQRQPSITLDIYSHVIPSQQSQATEAVQTLFG